MTEGPYAAVRMALPDPRFTTAEAKALEDGCRAVFQAADRAGLALTCALPVAPRGYCHPPLRPSAPRTPGGGASAAAPKGEQYVRSRASSEPRAPLSSQA